MDIRQAMAAPDVSIPPDSFQEMLVRISAVAAHSRDISELGAEFCTSACALFGCAGAFVWAVEGEDLIGVASYGASSEDFAGSRLKPGDQNAVCDAIRSKKAIITTANLTGISRFSEHFSEVLAVPALVGGRLAGAILIAHKGEIGHFDEDFAAKSLVLATNLAAYMESTRLSRASHEEHSRAENLMGVALELNSSIRLPELVRSFTERAGVMLESRAAALALNRGPFVETVFLHEPDAEQDKASLHRLNLGLAEVLAKKTPEVICAPASELLGQNNPFEWQDLTIARLTGTDGETIGVLCLADRLKPLDADDSSLISALAGHASVALENSRLFTRLSQANRHWVEIFDAISDFIVVHDEVNKVLRINKSLADFIGAAPPDLTGVSMRTLMAITQESAADPCPFCRLSMDGMDEYIHPLLERTYLISTSRIHGALNEGMQTIHVMKDITDRREAERRYRELFDNIQEGLFFTSPDGRFIEVNDALVRMLGYDSREELLQVDIPNQLYLTAEQRDRFTSLLNTAGVARNFEEVLCRKDGALIVTLQNAFAVRDAQGRVTQYRGLMLDITELKNFQTELQRQRDFNVKILNNTQSLILVVDTAGLISYANRRCYDAGCYTPGELLGRPLAELVPPTRRLSFVDALEATLSGQQVDNLDVTIQRGDGRIGQFSVNMSPMRDEQGNVSSLVVVMADITDAAVLQAKLMHTEKLAAVGQLVSGVAHEVNNPLTAILGFADLLLSDRAVPEAAKRDLTVIIQEAQRTKQIVQNLLSFARQMPPQRQPVDVNSILRRTLQLRAYDLANHGIDITQRFEERMPQVVGDSHQLQQVFLNILNNAYDAVSETGLPGRIVISTSQHEGFAEIRFTDNGNGIKSPDRIFDPFYTTKEVGKGTGLGLSICYGIVREHGGEISCHNNAASAGATFIVRLPLVLRPAMLVTAPGGNN